ncbi:serine hydrolase [Pseudanabaena sp. PCC 6802]|uniref:serine hydrolase n=1 Tax=Pseudanabaena sp. PCC 6802 TaxID=118173 RepID=UPI00034DEDC2|nr:serine hydrolase [Pseudanabaena sp. PCC 6802]
MSRESRLKRLKEGKNQPYVSIARDRVTSISEGTALRDRKIQPNQTQVATLPKPPLKSQSKSTSLRRSHLTQSLAKNIGWQVLRLVVIGVGLSAIAGTLIYFWQSAASRTITAPIGHQVGSDKKEAPDSTDLPLKAELTALTAKIKQLAAPESDLSLQTLVFDADTGVYTDVNSRKPIASASIIKIPLLIAFLQDVDEGKVQLGEQLEISKDVIVGEAGGLQYEPEGTKISALETLTEMIVHSDNTATNMIMKRIGGKDAANRRFKSWGLNSTVIRNQLPDLEGTNTTSPYDLVNLLSMVDKGKLLSPRSRDRLMDIMRRPVTNTLLPQGIAADARIVHKTGDIRSVVGDAGIIDMPSGRRYIMAAIVKRPDNDQRANELIRQVSRATYDYLKTNNSNSSPNSVSPPIRKPATNPASNSIDSTIQAPDTTIVPPETSNVNDSETSSLARSQQPVVNTQP